MSDKEDVELVSRAVEPHEGAVILSHKGLDVIIPSCYEEGVENPEEAFEEVVNALTFVVYAMDRDDWRLEFFSEMIKAEEEHREKEKREAEKKRRSHLKVIK